MEQYHGQLSALQKEQVVLKENSAKVAAALGRSEDQCEEMKQAMDKVLTDQKNDKEHHRQELKELKLTQQEMNKVSDPYLNDFTLFYPTKSPNLGFLDFITRCCVGAGESV